jgi:cytochrome c
MRWMIIVAATGLLAACGGGSNSETVDDTETSDPAASTRQESATPASAEPPAAAEAVDLSYLPMPYSEADYDSGRRLFRRCGSCHTVADGGGNRVGPNLYGMFGREAGSVENFNYSTALENADFVWTPEQLDGWLANPRDFLPGNRMSFVGLREETDRRDVIAYVMHETGYPHED